MSSGKSFGEGGASRPVSQALHPFGITSMNRLRMVDQGKMKEIAASMKAIGLITPITVRPNTVTGMGYILVVGAHRLAAAKHLNWESIDAIIVDVGEEESRIAEIDENLKRSDLSPAERSMHVAERKRLYEARHPETKNGAAGKHRPQSQLRKVCEPEAERFTSDTAKKTGVSERKVQMDVARGEKIEDLGRVVGTSLDKGEELDALAKLPKVKQQALIERAASGEKVSARTESKKVARADKEKALADKTITASLRTGNDRYGVIYADPPWAFSTYSENGMDRSAENHYPTMDLESIKALEVPAAADAVLYLWATVPMLPEALEVLEAWGFTYKSHIAWVKPRVGTGYWTRNQHEILLIGTRGNIPAPAMGTQPSSVVQAPVTRHSAKPAVFAEMIEELFPTLPKVELFCRSPRKGWSAHGNEI